MKSPTSGSEGPVSDEDAERAARLDECIALSALCMDLALAGAQHRARIEADRAAGDPVVPASGSPGGT